MIPFSSKLLLYFYTTSPRISIYRNGEKTGSVPNSYTKNLNYIDIFMYMIFLIFFNTGYFLYGLSFSTEIPSYLIKLTAGAISGVLAS